MNIFFKKSIFILSFLLFSYSVFAGLGVGYRHNNYIDSNDDPAYDAGNLHNHATADSILRYAYNYIGTPYRSGNIGPNAFDCSGFTSYIFGKFGYRLTHNSGAQSNYGIPVSRDNLQPGDLVFFRGRNSRAGRIGHVGIVSAINPDGSFSFIHAACSKGVANDNSAGNYYAMRYVTARRIIGPENYMRQNTLLGKTKFLEHIGAIDQEEDNNIEEQVDWSQVQPLVLLPEEQQEMDSANQIEYTPEKIRVRRNQSLVSISRKYGCSVKELKQWNHLRGNRVRRGKYIYVEDPESPDDGGEVEVSDLNLTEPDNIEKQFDKNKHTSQQQSENIEKENIN